MNPGATKSPNFTLGIPFTLADERDEGEGNGGAGSTATSPSVANAVFDALSHKDVKRIAMPVVLL